MGFHDSWWNISVVSC